MTVKQMQALVDSQNETIEQQNQMLRVCFSEIDKLNMVVIRMLDAQGLLDKRSVIVAASTSTHQFLKELTYLHTALLAKRK